MVRRYLPNILNIPTFESSNFKQLFIFFFFTEATDMFIKPRSINVTSFWSFHPHKPKTIIPFRPSKLYNRKYGGHRKWVSYCVKKKAIYCNICLCYGDGSR